MKSPLSKNRILVLLALAFFVALLLSYEHILIQIGRFLVFEQPPQKADLIVVLNGRDTERSLAAVDLYKQGYANLIVLARASEQPELHEFWKRVGSRFKRKIFFQRAIEAMGIPDDSFKLVGNGVTSTYDEAMVTKKFLAESGHKSILLVTSKWHSRRAYLTFRRAMNSPAITIIAHPSKYDGFDPTNWWKKETAAESVFREYARLLYYVITFRISLFSCIFLR